ncbi:MAG TPA: OmpA family protein [Chitinophagaceae bacterium]
MISFIKKYCSISLLMLFAFNLSFAQNTDTIVIHFAFDRSEITAEASSKLENYFTSERIALLTQLELYGHCDFIGDHDYNDALSLRRVEQAKDYLLRLGIPDNIIVKNEGYGKRRPLNENRTSRERLQNRRVELVIHWRVRDTVVTKPPPPEEKKPPVTLTEIIKDSTKVGQNIILRNLQFQPGRHYLLPESQPILDTLYQVMVDNPTLVIEIQGHVCCTPDNVDGLDIDLRTYDLSAQRAKAIFEHLVSRNISPERITHRGFGGSRKLYQLERNDFERQENRRVELQIIKR